MEFHDYDLSTGSVKKIVVIVSFINSGGIVFKLCGRRCLAEAFLQIRSSFVYSAEVLLENAYDVYVSYAMVECGDKHCLSLGANCLPIGSGLVRGSVAMGYKMEARRLEALN